MEVAKLQAGLDKGILADSFLAHRINSDSGLPKTQVLKGGETVSGANWL